MHPLYISYAKIVIDSDHLTIYDSCLMNASTVKNGGKTTA